MQDVGVEVRRPWVAAAEGGEGRARQAVLVPVPEPGAAAKVALNKPFSIIAWGN